MPTTENNRYLGRGIHDESFLNSLLNGKLNKMFQVILNDQDLDVQIRNNYLNVYYRGGNIARVSGETKVNFDVLYFYLGMKEVPTKTFIKEYPDELKELREKRKILIDKFKTGNYQSYFSEAKAVMNKWFDINQKSERNAQHLLSKENQYSKSDFTIIDLEYQVSTQSEFACTFKANGKIKAKNPRFDIIAINKEGKLCIIELKKGSGALKNTSGLKEHWECYFQSIGKNPDAFIREMSLVLEQKQALGLIDKSVKIFSSEPKFMFAYSYDDKVSQSIQDERFKIEYDKICQPIHVIKIPAGTYKLMEL